MSIGWDTLNAAKLGEIEEAAFEQLCRDLLDVERADRHDTRSELVGPAKRLVADGGCDLTFTVNVTPTEDERAYAKHYALTPLTPDQGRRAYSCKTGATWQRKVLDEAKTKGDAVIPVLRDKGSLFIFVHVPFVDRAGDRAATKQAKKKGSAKATAKNQPNAAVAKLPLLKQIVKEYAKRMPPGGPTETELEGRIRILDANELYRFLQARRPVLSGPMQAALGLVPPPGLLDIESWARDHAVDRPPAPAFVFDALREGIRDQIVSALTSRAPDPYDRALWIAGPPGIGKTRLVLEALRKDPRLAGRVLVAPSFDAGLRAVQEVGVFQQYRGVVLVIDDCPAHEVDPIARYVTKLGEDAALVVLTPHAFELLPPGGLTRRIEVKPLGQGETEKVIGQALGAAWDPEDVRRLASLSEGYPWFAALVAAEVKKGAPPPKTVADATDLALASRSHEGGHFHEIVIERARALLAVMLTEDVDWSELDDEKRRALYEAVDAPSWEALDKAKRACERRKLLRVRAGGKFKYVTPEILAREVARKLLTPPGGPSPIGPRLSRVPQVWSARLYERLDRLGLSGAELRSLASQVLARVDEAPPGLALLGPNGVPGAALLFAVRHRPREMAGRLRARIEKVSIETLRERRDLRRTLVFALDRTARSEGCFDDAERAIFRLAVAENEVYANNATQVWASLFLVPFNITKSPWDERIARLRERCADGSVEARRTALAGVAAAVSTHATVTRAAGEEAPERLLLSEAREARADAWLLLTACAQDDDAEVAREAGKLVVQHLRGAVREGMLERFAEALAAAMPRFDEASRRGVREALDHVRVYEGALVADSADLADGLRRIEEAVAPRSFPERLRQRVGAWGPPAERSQDDARDLALIREGLAPPERPLLAELDWLLSPAAVRNISFAIVLGRADVDRVALGPLVERTRTGAVPLVLSRYLIGMDDAGRGDDVDALLVAWGDDRALVEAAALVLCKLDPRGARPAYLASVVGRGLVSERALWSFTWPSWAQQLGTGALASLLAALLGQPSAAAATAALELTLDRIDAKPEEPDLHRPLLQAMKRLSSEPLTGMPAYAWERGVKRLLLTGAAQEACDVTIAGVLAGGEMASEHHWLAVHACEEQAPAELWEAVRAVLERGGRDAARLVVGLRWRGVGARFPIPSVLAWVGRHRGRASLVAEFAPVHGDDLPGVARRLISRFGADSAPAHTLAAAVGSTFKMVSSLAAHDRKQLGRVQRWRVDPDAQVRRWAESLARSLEHSAELNAAYEEHERRRFGT
jgi:hypothetical protein